MEWVGEKLQIKCNPSLLCTEVHLPLEKKGGGRLCSKAKCN